MWNLTVFSFPAKEKLNVMNNDLDLLRRSDYAYQTEAHDFSSIFDWVRFAQSSVYADFIDLQSFIIILKSWNTNSPKVQSS